MLFVLDLSNGRNLSRLPTTIWELKSLRRLYLSNCPKLEALPDILHPMESSLQFLDLSDNYNVKTLPNNISHLKSLLELRINNCKFIPSITRLPQSELHLQADNCGLPETLSEAICQMAKIFFRNSYKSSKSMTKPENIKYIARIFPGTEIPQCFPHRSVGPSITVPMPFDPSELLGITFCIVCLSNSPSDRIYPSMELKMKCYNETKTGDFFEGQISMRMPCPLETKSDNLQLGSCGIRYLDWNKYSKASIAFCGTSDSMLLVKKCGVYFHINEESSDSWGEEYSNSRGEGYPTGIDEDCSESKGEDAHGKGGCDDCCPNDAEVSTRTRASDEEKEENYAPRKKIKTH